jgi:hypothetical protein
VIFDIFNFFLGNFGNFLKGDGMRKAMIYRNGYHLFLEKLFSRKSRKTILKSNFCILTLFFTFLEFVDKFCTQIFPNSDHF